MSDKLRDELEKLLVVYDDACNEFVASTPNPSARDAEVRRYLLAFTDLYEAALAATADAPCEACNGQGFTMEGTLGGYYETPCPDCTTADAPPEQTEAMVRAGTLAVSVETFDFRLTLEDGAMQCDPYSAPPFRPRRRGNDEPGLS